MGCRDGRGPLSLASHGRLHSIALAISSHGRDHPLALLLCTHAIAWVIEGRGRIHPCHRRDPCLACPPCTHAMQGVPGTDRVTAPEPWKASNPCRACPHPCHAKDRRPRWQGIEAGIEGHRSLHGIPRVNEPEGSTDPAAWSRPPQRRVAPCRLAGPSMPCEDRPHRAASTGPCRPPRAPLRWDDAPIPPHRPSVTLIDDG